MSLVEEEQPAKLGREQHSAGTFGATKCRRLPLWGAGVSTTACSHARSHWTLDALAREKFASLHRRGLDSFARFKTNNKGLMQVPCCAGTTGVCRSRREAGT